MKSISAIIVFDGYCNLCGSVVRCIKKRDRKGLFTFIPLQSEEGRSIALDAGFEQSETGTVILLYEAVYHVRSDAVLMVFRLIGRGWNLLYAFKIVPRCIRDAVYRLVALTRYRIFGVGSSCAKF